VKVIFQIVKIPVTLNVVKVIFDTGPEHKRSWEEHAGANVFFPHQQRRSAGISDGDADAGQRSCGFLLEETEGEEYTIRNHTNPSNADGESL
jgi:hypothetical protein